MLEVKGQVLSYVALLRKADRPINEGAPVFLILLLALLVTWYDRSCNRFEAVPA